MNFILTVNTKQVWNTNNDNGEKVKWESSNNIMIVSSFHMYSDLYCVYKIRVK